LSTCGVFTRRALTRPIPVCDPPRKCDVAREAVPITHWCDLELIHKTESIGSSSTPQYGRDHTGIPQKSALVCRGSPEVGTLEQPSPFQFFGWRRIESCDNS